MKVVKLNRRFKQFKEHGHVVAMRFESHTVKAIAYERAAKQRLGGYGHDRASTWCSYFGTAPRGRHEFYTPRPYWITFRNEADLTLVLLSADLT